MPIEYDALEKNSANYVPLSVASFLDRTADIYPEREACLLYTSPSPRDATLSRMPSSA